MNLAPTTSEYVDDVGSKTTIRMLYPESSGLPELEYRKKGWTLLVIPFKLADIKWAECIMEGCDLVSARRVKASAHYTILARRDHRLRM